MCIKISYLRATKNNGLKSVLKEYSNISVVCVFSSLVLSLLKQRYRWVFKSGWASSNVVGKICPPGCNRVN